MRQRYYLVLTMSLFEEVSKHLNLLQILGICPFLIDTKIKKCYSNWRSLTIHSVYTAVLFIASINFWLFITLLFSPTNNAFFELFYQSVIIWYCDMFFVTITFCVYFWQIIHSLYQLKSHLKFVNCLCRLSTGFSKETMSGLNKSLSTPLAIVISFQTFSAVYGCFIFTKLNIIDVFLYGTVIMYTVAYSTILLRMIYVRYLVILLKNRITQANLVVKRQLCMVVVIDRNRLDIQQSFETINKLFDLKALLGRAFGGQIVANYMFDFCSTTESLFSAMINMYYNNGLNMLNYYMLIFMNLPHLFKTYLMVAEVHRLEHQVSSLFYFTIFFLLLFMGERYMLPRRTVN